MIGNDIVDLSDAETQPDALHPRFDARVFTRAERALLRVSGAPNRLRWILWAAKEAAYKVARKLDPRIAFSPSRFEVELDANLKGEVRCGERRFAAQVHETANSVHAVATDHDFSNTRIVWGAEELTEPAADGDPSQAARSLAVNTLAARLGAPADSLSIERSGRVPRLLGPAGTEGADLSLSHHGRLVAFACELSDAEHAPEARL